MKEVRLDLFSLYDQREKAKGSIKIILTNESKKIIKDVLGKIKTKEKLKNYELIEKFGINYSTFRMSIYRNRLSLNFIKNLLNYFSKNEETKIMNEIR